ncbi:hypothetical protein BSR29_06355 [Boudabousia liubingyangii]|uniref:AB hydrolase-1 domain-containing protein n=1 Tax=Boudabousia liubingyangii TaxID=1921764 RepID=A0A1Q5PKS6_9ACTO|nr:alpha/beta hydrolase [Boudabousia liubingyangii]OKL47236.1 hypothetical protein BSR29_06355 [Boudabousia liubingyangii]
MNPTILTHGTFSSNVPVVLLIPAFPLNAHQWDRVVEGLGDLPSIAFNAPGWFGEPLPDPVPSIEGYAEVIRKVVDDYGLTRLIVAGNSLGGYVAQTLAINDERVRGMLLVGTNGRTDSEEARSNRLSKAVSIMAGADLEPIKESALSLLGASATDQVKAEVLAATEGLTAESFAWCQRAMANRENRLSELELLKSRRELPVTIVQGTEDPASSIADAEDLARALSVTPQILEGKGHLLPNEAPALLAKILRKMQLGAS